LRKAAIASGVYLLLKGGIRLDSLLLHARNRTADATLVELGSEIVRLSRSKKDRQRQKNATETSSREL